MKIKNQMKKKNAFNSIENKIFQICLFDFLFGDRWGGEWGVRISTVN